MNSIESQSASRRLALAEAHRRFAEARPIGRTLYEKACKWLPGGNTRTILHHEPFPLSVESAEGSEVWDHDGHCYVDFLNDHTAGLYGHSHAAVIEAVKAALAGGLNGCGNGRPEVEAAALICERYTSIEKVRFTPSGTEANLMALTLARVKTGRSKIVTFIGAYHGSGLLFRKGGSGSNLPFDFITCEYNDCGSLREVFDTSGQEIAAVLLEPMLGSGGCIPADREFLDAARSFTRQYGAVLIFDEVMTSRLTWGGLQSKCEATPDLTTLGKYMAGGLPIGAFGGSTELMDLLDPRNPGSIGHNGTFNNNALSMTAAVAALRSFDRTAMHRLNHLGNRLRRRLNYVANQRHARLQVSGVGSMLHFHVRPSPPTRFEEPSEAENETSSLLYFDLLEQGLRISPTGLLSLSMMNTSAHCELLIRGIERFLDERRALLAVG